VLILCGVLIVILGFALHVNPRVAVKVAWIVSGIAGGSTPTGVIEKLVGRSTKTVSRRLPQGSPGFAIAVARP
jgi:uncharacterized membrane protein